MKNKTDQQMFLATARNAAASIRELLKHIGNPPEPMQTLQAFESKLQVPKLGDEQIKAILNDLESTLKSLGSVCLSNTLPHDVVYHSKILLQANPLSEDPPSYPPGPDMCFQETLVLLEQLRRGREPIPDTDPRASSRSPGSSRPRTV